MSPLRTGGSGATHLRLLYLTVFLGFTAQQVLVPLLPPLTVDLGLSEIGYGVLVSSSALVVALLSPTWGRISDRWGRRPVVLVGVAGSALGLGLFSLTVHAGLSGVLGGGALLGLLIGARGLLFGGSLAALPVAAQGHVVDISPDATARLEGIARIGAAVGLGLVLGPGLGGLLAPLGAVPTLTAVSGVLAVLALALTALLPRAPAGRPAATSRRPHLRHTDARIRGWLLLGWCTYLSTSLLQTTIAFLLRDRLGLDGTATVALTGAVLLAGGIPMLVVQWFLIPRLRWSPHRLIAIGLPLVAMAFATLAVASPLWLISGAVVVSGIGHSLAIPGYTTRVSLAVDHAEQGAVAGVTASTNAVALTVGPVLATTLYSVGGGLAVYGSGAALLASCSVTLVRHRGG